MAKTKSVKATRSCNECKKSKSVSAPAKQGKQYSCKTQLGVTYIRGNAYVFA